MEQFTVTDKYRKKRTIKGWNKPTIWLCNQNPFNFDERTAGIDYEWLRGNSVVVKIDRQLYDNAPPAEAPAAPSAPPSRAVTPMQVDEVQADPVQSTPSQWPASEQEPVAGPSTRVFGDDGNPTVYYEDLYSQPLGLWSKKGKGKEPEVAPKETVNLHRWFA